MKLSKVELSSTDKRLNNQFLGEKHTKYILKINKNWFWIRIALEMKIRGLYIKLGLNQILNKNTRNSKILNKMMKSLT